MRTPGHRPLAGITAHPSRPPPCLREPVRAIASCMGGDSDNTCRRQFSSPQACLRGVALPPVAVGPCRNRCKAHRRRTALWWSTCRSTRGLPPHQRPCPVPGTRRQAGREVVGFRHDAVLAAACGRDPAQETGGPRHRLPHGQDPTAGVGQGHASTQVPQCHPPTPLALAKQGHVHPGVSPADNTGRARRRAGRR